MCDVRHDPCAWTQGRPGEGQELRVKTLELKKGSGRKATARRYGWTGENDDAGGPCTTCANGVMAVLALLQQVWFITSNLLSMVER
jgi:hypothetical protein